MHPPLSLRSPLRNIQTLEMHPPLSLRSPLSSSPTGIFPSDYAIHFLQRSYQVRTRPWHVIPCCNNQVTWGEISSRRENISKNKLCSPQQHGITGVPITDISKSYILKIFPVRRNQCMTTDRERPWRYVSKSLVERKSCIEVHLWREKESLGFTAQMTAILSIYYIVCISTTSISRSHRCCGW